MRLKLDEKGHFITLSPATEEERRLIRRVVDHTNVNGLLKYGGRSGAPHHTPYSEHMKLHFKLGGERITLIATSDDDEYEIRGLRDAIYFGGPGLFIVEAVADDSINVCVAHCKSCGSPLATMVQTESKTCHACAETCEHEFEDGFGHGGNALLTQGRYCGKCGRKDPEVDSEVIIPMPTEPGEQRMVFIPSRT